MRLKNCVKVFRLGFFEQGKYSTKTLRYMKSVNRILSSGGVFIALCIGSCTSTNTHGSASAISAEEVIASAPFSADSAYRYIAEQVAFGPRVPGSTAHIQCADWIGSKLRSWGYTVVEQRFPGQDYYGKLVEGRNIIAYLSPSSQDKVLLMAHWDTRAIADFDQDPSRRGQPILGADDGGSGVGVLLEIARQNALLPHPLGVDFIFFDLEDGGNSGDNDSWCLGSQYWAKNPHLPDYKADYAILLDMVGSKGAKFHWEGYSKVYAAPIMYKIWQKATSLGWGKYFINSDGGDMVDDHVPVIKHRGIPAVDIINYDSNNSKGFGDHWHTHGDNLNIIDKETLRAVGETISTVLRDK